ncbi:MAG: D-lactate dehydrogenase [Elusimicrobia bacterium ADurb.Bin231]|nr:MAG: D-lactate dehydrogenase [Elusimicrobia bacterium ADurb.Bin231]
MKINIFETEKWEREYFETLSVDNELNLMEEPLTKNNAEKFSESEIISAFIYSDLSKKVLQKLKNLKFIATRSTGFNHIDLNYCSKHQISVSNVPRRNCCILFLQGNITCGHC